MSENTRLISLQELHKFDNFEVLARQVVEGSIIGLHKSPFHGFSVEFAEHRTYNPGDPMKSIDWKVYGRTDKLFVKKFEEETNLRCRVVIDASSSMYFPEEENRDKDIRFNKLAFSIISAGALMHIFKRQRDAVALSIFTDSVEEHTRTRSTTVHHNLINSTLEKYLRQDKRGVKTAAAKCLHEIAENTPRRSMVIIFSDMLENVEHADSVFSALQHLKHNKHEIVLFHVVDQKKEVDFEFENRPYLFVDLETNEKVKIESNSIKDHYQAQMKKFKQGIMMKCAQYQIDFVEADINKDFSQIVIPYLNKRAKMMA